MLSKIFRVLLSSSLISYGVFLITDSFVGNGISLIIVGSVVLFTYFKNEKLLLTFWFLRKQDFVKAEKFINYIKHPDTSLIKSQRAYYYYLLGLINSQKQVSKSMTLAQNNFKKALDIGLNMDHDKAMAYLQLSALAMAKRRKQEAQRMLTNAKKLDKTKMLSDQIKMLQSQIKMPIQKNMDHFRMGGAKVKRR